MPNRSRLIRVRSVLSLVAFAVLACAAPGWAQSDADKRILAQLALRWAVDGGIADVKLLKDPSIVPVANVNLPRDTRLAVPNRTVQLLSPMRIQATADTEGDFLYFVIGPFRRTDDRVRVPIALHWAVSLKHKGPPYLSGGGAALEFRSHDGQWQLQPVQEQWSS